MYTPIYRCLQIHLHTYVYMYIYIYMHSSVHRCSELLGATGRRRGACDHLAPICLGPHVRAHVVRSTQTQTQTHTQLLTPPLTHRQFIVCMHICAPSCLGPRAVAAEFAITLLNRYYDKLTVTVTSYGPAWP
jgi:hypothetical protein